MADLDRMDGWQLDEEGAAAYERNLVPLVMAPWAADLVQAVDVKPEQHVLDVACGTGVVARHAAGRVGPGGQVTGIDVNPAMLAVARDAASGIVPPIEFKEAHADDLPFADASFDVVLCQQALQFFPDPSRALAEMARVLRPSGRLGVGTCRSIEHQPGYLALTETLTRHVGVNAADIIRSPYTLGDPDELRALVTAGGFSEVRVRFEVSSMRFPSAKALLEAETSSSPLGDLVDQLDGDVLDALLGDLATALRPQTDDDGVVFPFQTLVVTAVR